jgi:hypothetical protein
VADGFLVAVGGGGVDGPVAGGEGVGDDLLGLLVGDLEHAETEDRHLDAVVERDQAVLWGHDDFLRSFSGLRRPGWAALRWLPLVDSTKPDFSRVRQ